MSTDYDNAVNDWALGSGLNLDGMKAEITKCDIGPRNDIVVGALFVNMTFTPIDGDGDDEEQSFSVGKGWEVDRTGQNLVPESGKKKTINMSTNYGILLQSAIDLFKPTDGTDKEREQKAIEALAEVLGSPKHAPNWIGTMWEVGTITKMKKNPSTGVEKEGPCWVFTEWLGSSIDAGQEEAAPEPTKTTAKAGTRAGGSTRTGGTRAGAKAGKSSGPTIPDGIDRELWDELIALAIEVQDRDDANEHEDFMELAVEVEGVEGNKAANKVVAGSRAGSVWDAAKKAPRDQADDE